MDLEWIENQPREVEVGDRIKLVNMPDDPHPLEAGTEGTVTSVDKRMEVIGVKWDNGSRLNLVLGVDSFDILNEGGSDKAIISKSMPKPTLKGRDISPTRSKMNNNLKKSLQKSRDIKVESEKLVGGKADGLTPSDIAKKHKVELKEIQKEIELGIEIEMEHTDSPIKAKEVVMDHLFEFPDYYSNKKYGLKASEKGLEKVHETTILEFFGAFGKKNKDSQYNLETLGNDLKRITDVLKTAKFPHRESVRNMIETFRGKYSEHSQIDTMMKSLYHEFDKIGGEDIEETTSAGSAGAFSGPLGGVQKRNESRIIKVRDLLEGTTTQNTDRTDGTGPFDGNAWVDMDGDGWMFDDKPAWEGGEIVDILATTKNINWRDDNLDISSEIPKEKKTKAKLKKEDLIRTIRLLETKEEEELDETTTALSSGQYSGPMFAAKDDNSWNLGKKPIWTGGKIVQKVKNSGVLSEINKIKWHKDGSYVKLKDSCTKFNNQPWCSAGNADKPVILSKTTSDNISEVAKKLGISKEDVKKVVINQLTR